MKRSKQKPGYSFTDAYTRAPSSCPGLRIIQIGLTPARHTNSSRTSLTFQWFTYGLPILFHEDARKLSSGAQQALRERVLAAVRDGMKKTKAMKVFGASRTAIGKWFARFRKGGERALRSGKREHRKGIQLKPLQAAQSVRMITDCYFDQLKMPFPLWTREALGPLIEDKFGVTLSVCTMVRYLARSVLTPLKPLLRAFEQAPKTVSRRLEHEHAPIQRQAKRVGAEVYLDDACFYLSYSWSTRRRPDNVQAYFQAESVRYTAHGDDTHNMYTMYRAE